MSSVTIIPITNVTSRMPALPSNRDDVRGSLALIFVLMYEESADLSTLISSILKLFIEEFDVTGVSLQRSQESQSHEDCVSQISKIKFSTIFISRT